MSTDLLADVRRLFILSSLGTALLLLTGCNSLGTKSLASGRGVYNEVINRTEDEQILNMIVRLRYGQTFGMLTVASVAANVKASASAGADFGIGPSRNYDGNLVPLSVGVAYEENPTISYVPLGGEEFAQNLFSPLTLDQAGLISRVSLNNGTSLMQLLVNRVNNLTNPILGHVGGATGFDRMASIMRELSSAGMMRLVRSDEPAIPQHFIQIYDYAGLKEELVVELLDLYEIRNLEANGQELLIPIRAAIGRADGKNISVELRSVFDLIVSAGTSIQIPEEHLESGIVEMSTREIPSASQIMQIQSSREAPTSATVAVKLEGWWFFIDKSDHRSKRGFFLLRALIGMRLRDTAANQMTPLMTIGVDNE